MACDCRLHHLIHHGGVALNVGRDVRTAPRALRRALRLRDGGCAFPGCGQTRFVHAHHIVYWEHGGRHRSRQPGAVVPPPPPSPPPGRLHLRRSAPTVDRDFADPNGRNVVPVDGREPPVVSPLPAWHQRQRKRPVEPTAARARSGGEPLTAYALDIILHNLLTTSRTAA